MAIELMVGHAHLGGFGSIEGLAQAKAELLWGLRNFTGKRYWPLSPAAEQARLVFQQDGYHEEESAQNATPSLAILNCGDEKVRQMSLRLPSHSRQRWPTHILDDPRVRNSQSEFRTGRTA